MIYLLALLFIINAFIMFRSLGFILTIKIIMFSSIVGVALAYIVYNFRG